MCGIIATSRKEKRQPWNATTLCTTSPTRPFDQARHVLLSEVGRVSQQDARQLLYDYMDGLWADITRAGERPAVGGKYQAIAAMRELTGVLRTIAFEAVYDAPE